VRDNPIVAARTLRNSGENTRALLLDMVSDLPLVVRRELAKLVDAENVVIDIPGIDYKQLYEKK
jgi:hypothetical protein